MKKFSQRTVLLDAHAIIHRAYHALPDFTTRDGTPTGGLYGVCTMLLKIIEELQPDHIIACYDLPKPTFRHSAYEDYKGTRKESEEPLKEQLQTSRDIFHAFNIPIYEQEGYEADDVLGTLSGIITSDQVEHQVIIASGDMDTLQLVQDNQVQVYTLKKGINDTILYNEDRVRERFGFGSDLIPDYKGLAGDASDNIKGVPGIGAKTAALFIQTYGTIEQCLEAIQNDKESVIEGGISKRMVGLLEEHSEDALFSKELATIHTSVPLTYQTPAQNFKEGINLAQIGELFRKLEFRTLNQRLHKVLGIKTDEQQSLLHNDSDINPQELKQAQIGVYVLNPTITEPTLDDVMRYGESFSEAFSAITQEIKDQNLLFVWQEIECSIIEAVEHMNQTGFCIDRAQLKKLSKRFHQKTDTLEKNIHDYAGETFNIKSTQQLSRILFEVLELPTKGIKKTPKGVISTKESELKKLQGEHKIIDAILEYRELIKLTSTYLDNILPMIDDSSGRLQTTFIQTGTTTGRMSSRDPNLQNIPTGGTYGKEIRTMFIPQEGYELVSCDYSQIELRMAAQLSEDEKLLKYFADGRDIHSAVAQELFNEETAENRRKAKVINFGILYGMGAQALRLNLGGGYSLKEARAYLDAYFERFPTLANYLESTKEFAHQHKYTETLFGRRRYFGDIDSKVPFIRAAAERMAVNAPIQGTATADVIKLALRDVYEYIHTNKLENHIHIIAQVHDELLFEIKQEVYKKESKQIKKIMEQVLEKYAQQVNKKALVSLQVDCNHGSNWAEIK